MEKYHLVIFDLDGTLIDSSQGIYNSVRYAEKMMNFNPIAEERLKEFVGPPPQKMYASIYNANEEQSFQATLYHRQYGKEYGIYEATVYSGIKELLCTLKAKGMKLAVATLKLQTIAEMVLKHYGLYDFFDAIIGMNDAETLTKAETIAMVLEETKINKQNALMIGDSVYDEIGAKQAGVDFVAALYGFGFDKENSLTAIRNPMELFNILQEN